MATHELHPRLEPTVAAAGCEKKNASPAAAGPPAPAAAVEAVAALPASDSPRKRSADGLTLDCEKEHEVGPPSKRWRQGLAPLPWADNEAQAPAPRTNSQGSPAATTAAAAEPCVQYEHQAAACSASIPAASAQQADGELWGEQRAEDAAVAGEGCDGLGHPQLSLPDWCDRPLMLYVPEDGGVEAFSYLPGHPLLALACEGQASLLAKVIEMGADPDATDSRGLTALHMACRHAQLACVRCLLEGGASTSVPDAEGRMPADEAAAAGHTDVEDMLRQHEAVQAALAKQRSQP